MTKKSSTEQDPTPFDLPIHTIRGQRVVLDSDLARMYGVTTSRFNEAFKRSFERFPADFAFPLTDQEADSLRSQIAISKNPPVIDSKTGPKGGRRYLPWAFTEHGAVMAANILRGDRAVRMSVFVVRAFVRMREQVAANRDILARLAEIDDKLLEHDDALRDLYERLLLLLESPPEPQKPKRTMGFRKEPG